MLVLLLTSFSLMAGQNEFRMITLKHRFAEDILPIVQPMVGESGTANAMDNHLIIRTTPDRMAAIEQVVAEFDVARRNIRIEISHENNMRMDRSRAAISGRARTGDGEIIIGDRPPRRSGANVEIGKSSGNISRRGGEFVTVMDGADAFIRVGQSVPYTQQWAVFTRRYAHVGQTTEFRDITTGFAVRPRYIGDTVEVEIVPRIARLNSSGFIDFEELATTVRLTPGEWFDLGGTMGSRDEVSRAILGSRSASASESTALMIRVD